MDTTVFADDSRRTQKGKQSLQAGLKFHIESTEKETKKDKPAVQDVVEENLDVDLGGHFE